MTEVRILDYGMGNLRSVQKAFEALGRRADLVSRVDEVEAAEILVLPGVGAFGEAMERLSGSGLDRALVAHAAAGKPLLGICLGMQLLFERSDEKGDHRGLGLLPGRVVRFPGRTGYKVPHMGWNQIEPAPGSALLARVAPGSFAYFVHSYHADGCEPGDVLAWTDYGGRFPSIVGRDQVVGIQFHPEKSRTVGLEILSTYLGLSDRRRNR